MKCPADAIYIQILPQLQTENFISKNLNSNATYVNIIKNANDAYKQLLLSVGEYVT